MQVQKLTDELNGAKSQIKVLEQGANAMATMFKETQDHLNTMKNKMNILLVSFWFERLKHHDNTCTFE